MCSSGSKAPENICAGQLIFEDNFDSFDQSTWQHVVTLSGGRNAEFQWYVNDGNTSFAIDGKLHIRPRLTTDHVDDDFLTDGHILIPPHECTNSAYNGCEKQGTLDEIINPVRSARIRTFKSLSFKYGIFETSAKMPAGDWLFPAIWFIPSRSTYGPWPISGEIDLVESRGNRQLYNGNTNVGVEQIGSTLHFGPQSDFNGWRTAHYEKNIKNSTYASDFHTYRMEWTPEYIRFIVDNSTIGTVKAGKGFWQRGNFSSSGLPDPWIKGTQMAPFDQEFHIIINMAVGGTGFFSDTTVNKGYKKPWSNKSPKTAARDFWKAKKNWLQSWNYNRNDDADFQIDYIRVWAL